MQNQDVSDRNKQRAAENQELLGLVSAAFPDFAWRITANKHVSGRARTFEVHVGFHPHRLLWEADVRFYGDSRVWESTHRDGPVKALAHTLGGYRADLQQRLNDLTSAVPKGPP